MAGPRDACSCPTLAAAADWCSTAALHCWLQHEGSFQFGSNFECACILRAPLGMGIERCVQACMFCTLARTLHARAHPHLGLAHGAFKGNRTGSICPCALGFPPRGTALQCSGHTIQVGAIHAPALLKTYHCRCRGKRHLCNALS